MKQSKEKNQSLFISNNQQGIEIEISAQQPREEINKKSHGTLYKQNTKATGSCGRSIPNPQEAGLLFALHPEEQIVQDACTFRKNSKIRQWQCSQLGFIQSQSMASEKHTQISI